MSESGNVVVTNTWSNPASQELYQNQWPDDPACRELYHDGRQCGGCSFFAKLNFDWGLCLHAKSRHYLETVFEHFTCPAHVDEGWGAHSFTELVELHRLGRPAAPDAPG